MLRTILQETWDNWTPLDCPNLDENERNVPPAKRAKKEIASSPSNRPIAVVFVKRPLSQYLIIRPIFRHDWAKLVA